MISSPATLAAFAIFAGGVTLVTALMTRYLWEQNGRFSALVGVIYAITLLQTLWFETDQVYVPAAAFAPFLFLTREGLVNIRAYIKNPPLAVVGSIMVTFLSWVWLGGGFVLMRFFARP